MEKLTKEEVLHVANLARIEIEEEAIEKYSIELKQLINDIDKIRDIESTTTTILVTPAKDNTTMRTNEVVRNIDFEEIKKNLPRAIGKFVEVPVTNHD